MSKIIKLKNDLTGYVMIKFHCPKCNFKIMSDIMPLPNVILTLDDPSALNTYYTSENCGNCGETYNIFITSEGGETSLEIEEIPQSVTVTVVEAESNLDFIDDYIATYLYDTDTMKVFRTEIQKLKDLLDIEIFDKDLQTTLLKQIYSGTVTCLEDYLSTTLIKEVLSNKSSLNNFVLNDYEISKRNFKLYEIINEDAIRKIAKERLLSIMYHNLGVVKHLYKKIYSFEIPEYEEIAKIINNRHHMVHRNGKNLEGEIIVVDKKTVRQAVLDVEKFIQEIDLAITLQ